MIKKNARNAAVSALLKTDENSGYSNIVIDKAIKSFELSPKDASLSSIIFYGVLEKRITLDYILSQYSKTKVSKMQPEIREILRAALYQLLFLDKIPESAAVNEAVNSAKEFASQKSAGFVNGILRAFLRNEKKYSLPKSRKELLSVKYSVPVWLVSHFEKYYGEETAKNFFESLEEHPPVFIRVNTTKTTEDDLIKLLSDEGVTAEKTNLKNALSLKNQGNPTSLKAFADGLFHVQDLSSQLACFLLSPKEDSVLTDVCAAPGGKTFTLSEIMNNKGKVYSHDLYKGKVGLIKNDALRLSLDIVEASVRDAEKSEVYNESDFVLCDAPCSGLGIIRRKPEIRYKDEKEMEGLPSLQYDILVNSSKCVKVGGMLMYSTCTLNPKENGENARRFLKENPDFEAVSIELQNGFNRAIDEKDNEFTMFPHKTGTDGFFVSLFKRVK